MAGDSNSRKITIILDETFIEELRGWLTVNCGEIVKVEKPRKKTPATQVQQEPEEDDPPSNFEDRHREIISAETRPEGHYQTPDESHQISCSYCRTAPCILQNENLPSRLRAYGQPKMTNHVKRKGDYKAFYTILKRRGLWRDPVYLQRKEALGCFIEDVREVMPVCVVEDVRKRWPNPHGVPYCGHRRS